MRDIEVAILCEMLHTVPSVIKNEVAEEMWKVRTILIEKAQAQANASKRT